MTRATFTVQDTPFEADLTADEPDSTLSVRSVPRPYEVHFPSDPPAQAVGSLLASAAHPLVLIDRAVLRAHLDGLRRLPTESVMEVEATERFKSVDGALSVLTFLDERQMSRASLLVVIGGGIVQDVGAFSACVYKRGVPWAYVPTTLLAQADSCIGAKSGLNFKGAKNLIGVFSAPREVLVHSGFLDTLPDADVLSGLGEVFRLSIIGGPESLALYAAHCAAASRRSLDDLRLLTHMALSIKRAVIEHDEFEVDLRRSMNFGHTVGHALEAITDHAIPHGTAVAVGVLVESHMTRGDGGLPTSDWEHLIELGGSLIPQPVREVLAAVNFDHLLRVLGQDKKAEGAVLKLVVPERIGAIRFRDLPLVPSTVPEIQHSLETVLDRL